MEPWGNTGDGDAQQFGNSSLKEIYDLIDVPAICALFIVSGYRDVLGRSKFHFSKEDVEAFLGQIDQEGIPVSAEPLKLHLSDSDDGPFLQVALAGRAKAIVTGKKRQFPGKEYEGTKILSPTQCLEIIRGEF